MVLVREWHGRPRVEGRAGTRVEVDFNRCMHEGGGCTVRRGRSTSTEIMGENGTEDRQCGGRVQLADRQRLPQRTPRIDGQHKWECKNGAVAASGCCGEPTSAPPAGSTRISTSAITAGWGGSQSPPPRHVCQAGMGGGESTVANCPHSAVVVAAAGTS